MKRPPILCRLSDRGVVPDRAVAQVRDRLRELAGKVVVIDIHAKKDVRSLGQNAWWWGVFLPALGEELGYDRDELPDLHEALLGKYFGQTFDERLGVWRVNRRSSDLNTEEFSEFMEWGVRFAAREHQVVIELPDERGLLAYVQAPPRQLTA
jgi:hypothetical protein